jgi:hypothetical protein
VGPTVGPPDHAEANFIGGTLVQRGSHVYVYGTSGDEAQNAAVRKAAETLADWGPNVRARFKVVADTDVTPEMMAAQNLVLVGNATVNRVVARLAPRLALRQDARGTFAGAKRVAGPDASYRLHTANPLAPGRYVLIYGAATETGFKPFRPAPGPRSVSGLADYLVIGEDGQTALAGYFKDDWTIPDR